MHASAHCLQLCIRVCMHEATHRYCIVVESVSHSHIQNWPKNTKQWLTQPVHNREYTADNKEGQSDITSSTNG